MEKNMIASTGYPIVILGGFLSPGSLYRDMVHELIENTGRPVQVVNTKVYDWLLSFNQVGWVHLLNKLDHTITSILESTTSDKVVVVGHSQGGVLSRLYLSDDSLVGRIFNGKKRVAQLVTLGSPHINQGGMQRGGPVSRWVERHYPGAFFSPEVTYVSVAGKAVKGDPTGSAQQRFVSKIYQEICGGDEGGDWACAWGDGIVPVHSALLPGAKHIVLDGVAHFSVTGSEWYGSASVIPRWWHQIEPNQARLSE